MSREKAGDAVVNVKRLRPAFCLAAASSVYRVVATPVWAGYRQTTLDGSRGIVIAIASACHLRHLLAHLMKG